MFISLSFTIVFNSYPYLYQESECFSNIGMAFVGAPYWLK